MRYLVPINTGNWARYVDRIKLQVQTRINQYRLLGVLPNRLTSIYSKNHYKEENYLKGHSLDFYIIDYSFIRDLVKGPKNIKAK